MVRVVPMRSITRIHDARLLGFRRGYDLPGARKGNSSKSGWPVWSLLCSDPVNPVTIVIVLNNSESRPQKFSSLMNWRMCDFNNQ